MIKSSYYRLLILYFSTSLIIISCHPGYFPQHHELPEPEDTTSKEINYQEKKEYIIDGIHADNLFDAARLNNFVKINKNTYRAIVSPENSPINKSTYFAFRIWSEVAKEINLEIFYTEHRHRYWPKLSYDKLNWMPADSSRFDTLKAGNIASLKINLDERPLFVAAQELMDTDHTKRWCEDLSAIHEDVNHEIIGQSVLDRNLHFLDIYNGYPNNKECVVIFSRLHPPEVTGHMAMEHFVEELLRDTVLSNTFRKKFRILVYPLMNPDGVDLGHWRHNAGGVDLNRDWAYYRQKECNTIANHLVGLVGEDKNSLILGLDFHSTQEDLYYSLTDNRRSVIYNFKDLWIDGIDDALEEYTPDDQAYDLNQPITKAWFYLEFNAESITYEVGDETSRSFIKEKAVAAAREMMKLLVLRN